MPSSQGHAQPAPPPSHPQTTIPRPTRVPRRATLHVQIDPARPHAMPRHTSPTKVGPTHPRKCGLLGYVSSRHSKRMCYGKKKSFLKLRSDWAGCRFPPKPWANPACGLCMARHWAPAAPVGLRIGPGLLRSCRAALGSHPCAWPGLSHLAPPALIACAPQRGANRKHAGIL